MPGSRTKPAEIASRPADRRRGEKAAAVRTPKSALAKPSSPAPPSSRAARAAERRAAIIDAAMDEFIARGFAATRLDDVANRAGVAKVMVSRRCKAKEALFQELI